MRERILKNCRSICRGLLFTVVLTGLLFSCGEGIRLLPFPMPAAGEGLRPILGLKNKIPYQSNIHRFEHIPGQIQFKHQRPDFQHHWARRDANVSGLRLEIFQTFGRNLSAPDQKIHHSLGFLASQAGRAPPLFS
ncbi:MAG: hypothetical protein R2747_08265 [Pyrinomonadaceae bacterium]